MNNKITQLNSLNHDTLNENDLFVVVDIDDNSSPTGETKNITVGELNEYISGDGSSRYIKKEFPWHTSYTESTFSVGQVVRVNNLGLLSLADYSSEDGAEVVGIVQSIDVNTSIDVIFSGEIIFGEDILTYDDAGSPVNVDLTPGKIYFLYLNGYMRSIDASTDNSGTVSKPVLLATGDNVGMVLNYRGMLNDGTDLSSTPTEIVVHDSECYDFVVGDVIRRKREGESGKTWKLASADSLDNSEVVGVVSEKSTTYFKISLIGYISTLCGLTPGKTYYLTPENANTELGILGWDITRTCRRNVTPTSPTCPYFSKPVYIAISETEAVIVNQRTLPNPDLNSSECVSGTAGRYLGGFAYTKTEPPSKTDAAHYMNEILPDVTPGDTATLYHSDPDTDASEGNTVYTMEYQNGQWYAN